MFICKAETQILPFTSIEDEAMKKSGIISRRRYVHIFYNENIPINSCKVIQINISTSRNKDVIFDKFLRNRHNGTLSFISVYVYDVELNGAEKNIKSKFLRGKLTLLTAKRLDRETDHDDNITYSELAPLFSKLYQNYSISEFIDARTLVNPKYYTQEHEYHSTGEFNNNGIFDDIYINSYYGSDIVDSETKIYLQDPGMFKTIKDTLLISQNEILFNGSFNKSFKKENNASKYITDVNYMLGCDNLTNGGVFTYDTQMGMNFKNTSLICKDFISKDSATEELETFLTALEAVGKSIESEFGSIRVMYAPSLIGSKCRILYKDFDNRSDDFGLKSDNNNASKDSSHEVTEVVATMIDDSDGIFTHDEIYEGIRYPELQKEKIISYYT